MPRPTGAILSPRSKLASARLYRAVTPAPPQFSRLATTLHFWGNDQFGVCVPTESMAAKAADGIIPSEAEGVAWARANGWLNGASLTDVMEEAIKNGIPIRGQTYHDGPYQAVVYTDYAQLCQAIFQGTVKIAVGASQLESCVTNSNGWMLLSARRDVNLDHCVGLHGYGPLAYCCQQLGVSVPSGADPAMPCVILFTWSTYGVVSFPALLGLMDSTTQAGNSEAWLRSPTTILPGPQPPQPPLPPPSPNPTPVPPPKPTPTPGPCPWRREDVEAFFHDAVRGVAMALRSFPK